MQQIPEWLIAVVGFVVLAALAYLMLPKGEA